MSGYALADFVILASFVACWASAGWSGKRAQREIQRRINRERRVRDDDDTARA